jgi:adenine-specific DNA-methyltransferase
MKLEYEGKKSVESILNKEYSCQLIKQNKEAISDSKLILGENGDVLRYLIDVMNFSGKIDFIYIDPPFSTNNIFTISKDKANSISRSIDDTIAYKDTLKGEEYLEFIRERLVLLKELLSDRGSIYLHIDYKIGHYLKIIMDEIFGANNFKNDISRIKCNPKNFSRKAFGNIKDLLLFYTKSKNNIWNESRIPLTEEEIGRLFKKKEESGRKYTTIPLHAPGETKNGITGTEWKGQLPPKGRHWRSSPEELDELDDRGLVEWSKNLVPRKKIYADESRGKKVQDIIQYKDPQKPQYPTEKNISLLKLLIKMSSDEDSIVLDCFCGGGTTLKAAQELGRKWIGIDSSAEAIRISNKKLSVTKKRLFDKEFEFLVQKNDEFNTNQKANRKADI